jgi:APA family basic amino acid/polyamine antiporter
LRRRQPNLHRPYRVWGYPVLPGLYILVALFFVVYIPIADPRNSGLGLLLTALGLPAYWFWRGRRA